MPKGCLLKVKIGGNMCQISNLCESFAEHIGLLAALEALDGLKVVIDPIDDCFECFVMLSANVHELIFGQNWMERGVKQPSSLTVQVV